MLPAARSHRLSLADVVPNCLDALAGRRAKAGLAPVSHVVVVAVDGLGHAALTAHAGHARTLASRLQLDGPIDAGFPSTTVAGLTTLLTGASAGTHGLVGYRVLVPGEDRVINQLSGWDGVDPAAWQRSSTVFEQATARGVRSVAITHPRYRDSEFTAAILRGAEFVGAADAASRRARLAEVLSSSDPAFVYYYVPDLDKAAHASGLDSGAWIAALEELDAELAGILPLLGPRDGLLVTADHGIVDVPEHAQRIADAASLDGVRHIAGEPRCLQLHLEPGVAADVVAERWRAREGRRAWIATRQEAIDAGLFGAVDQAVAPRIGDVLVAARGAGAYYAEEADPARGMIGQHGSLTAAETAVPLLRFGAWA